MPARVRDTHLAHVLEALIRYSTGGNALTFRSERDDSEMRITFMVRDAETYHETLSAVMNGAPLTDDGQRSDGEPH